MVFLFVVLLSRPAFGSLGEVDCLPYLFGMKEKEEIKGPIRAGTYSYRPVSAPNLIETLEPARESRYVIDYSITIQENQSLDPITALVVAPANFLINYIQISPSVRGNDVYVSINASTAWLNMPPATGAAGNYFPRADYVVRGSESTREYRLPAMKSATLYIVVWLPFGVGLPYDDAGRVIVGFVRDNTLLLNEKRKDE